MLMLALFVPLYTTGAVTTMLATDARVEWSGRHTGDATTGAVSFDWLSVTARVGVHGATYVRVVSTAAGATRTTRIKAYASDQGFQLYPTVQFWIPRSDESNATTVWQSGGVANVSWYIAFNHGGGYKYRICPKSEQLTEACFAKPEHQVCVCVCDFLKSHASFSFYDD